MWKTVIAPNTTNVLFVRNNTKINNIIGNTSKTISMGSSTRDILFKIIQSIFMVSDEKIDYVWTYLCFY